jgi:hypothetical protein
MFQYYRFLGAALIVGLVLSGCQATSQYAGSGPIRLTQSATAGLEKYLNMDGAAAFAIQTYGSGYHFNHCQHVRCVYQGATSAEDSAIKKCESRGGTCRILAVNREIVWNGEIHLPQDSGSKSEMRVEEAVSANSVTNYRMTVDISDTTKPAPFHFSKRNKGCKGSVDLQNGTWSFKCSFDDPVSGSIGPSSISKYWGRSSNGRYRVLINDDSWPKARAAINAANKAFATLSTSSPTTPQAQTVGADISADVIWTAGNTKHNVKVTYQNKKTGIFRTVSSDSSLKCAGTFTSTAKNAGSWKATCMNGDSYQGHYRTRNREFWGSGVDQNGRRATFTTPE